MPRLMLCFERRIVGRDGLLLLKVVSCAAIDACTDMSSMGPCHDLKYDMMALVLSHQDKSA